MLTHIVDSLANGVGFVKGREHCHHFPKQAGNLIEAKIAASFRNLNDATSKLIIYSFLSYKWYVIWWLSTNLEEIIYRKLDRDRTWRISLWILGFLYWVKISPEAFVLVCFPNTMVETIVISHFSRQNLEYSFNWQLVLNNGNTQSQSCWVCW